MSVVTDRSFLAGLPPCRPAAFYAGLAAWVASRRLLGAILVHRTPQGLCAGRIVETEAYDQKDPASHSFKGRTQRNASMFGPAGRAYVYRSYGIHWCINVTVDAPAHAAGVLLRALEPIHGTAVMATRRRLDLALPAQALRLTRGPGCLTEALAITGSHDGHPLNEGPLTLHPLPRPLPGRLSTALPRIGISRAKERLWRFCLRDTPHVSAPRPANK